MEASKKRKRLRPRKQVQSKKIGLLIGSGANCKPSSDFTRRGELTISGCKSPKPSPQPYVRFNYPLWHILPSNIDRSCRRCNRTPFDATLRSRSAEPPHPQAASDQEGNFRRPFAASHTLVGLPPPPAGGNKHSDTKISGALDWPLPDRHHIE